MVQNFLFFLSNAVDETHVWLNRVHWIQNANAYAEQQFFLFVFSQLSFDSISLRSARCYELDDWRNRLNFPTVVWKRAEKNNEPKNETQTDEKKEKRPREKALVRRKQMWRASPRFH